MLPDPLHPALVHLPLALAFLLPLFAGLGLFAIAREFLPVRAWIVVSLLAVLLFVSVLIAKEAGEDERVRVSAVVPEAALDVHEDRADLLTVLAAILLAPALLGLVPGVWGRAGRWLSLGLSLAILASAVATGKSGGDIAYHHGAAQIYRAEPATTPPTGESAEEGR